MNEYLCVVFAGLNQAVVCRANRRNQPKKQRAGFGDAQLGQGDGMTMSLPLVLARCSARSLINHSTSMDLAGVLELHSMLILEGEHELAAGLQDLVYFMLTDHD